MREQRGHRASADPRGQDESVGVGGISTLIKSIRMREQDISLISEQKDSNVLGAQQNELVSQSRQSDSMCCVSGEMGWCVG